MKGLNKVREKLPGFSGPRIAVLPISALIAIATGLLFIVAVDVIPRRLAGNLFLQSMEPIMPILAGVVLSGVALTLVTGLWRKRDAMLQEYGKLAYQRIIPRGVFGVSLIGSLVAHTYLSVGSLVPIPPVNHLTTLMSESLLSIVGVPSEIDMALRIILALPVLLFGLLLIRSALTTFGIDYMIVIYLYFPEESQIQRHEIYSVIRHPAYFAGVVMALAGSLSQLSVYSFAFLAIVYLTFKIHLRYEEGELLERFGDSYREYMTQVPGLHFRPSDLRAVLRFLRHPGEKQ
ncbi:MAG: methyltransferase family protein [Candidatus Thorarchaeota archaeon]|nr:MAG: hypothetical protein DRP09_03230 [Candidatus Thorarchaeota archaeon]